jgi:hypothetical protein
MSCPWPPAPRIVVRDCLLLTIGLLLRMYRQRNTPCDTEHMH